MSARSPIAIEPPSETGAARIKTKGRIDSLDVLRGVATLGILLLNIVGMGLPDPAYWDPSMIGGDRGANWLVWFINALFFEGTMRGLFSLLFGASMLAFFKRRERFEDAVFWYRRSIVLILLGLFHAYVLLWPGDILYTYGLVGVCLYPLRSLAPRRLVILALSAFMISSWLNLKDSQEALWLASQSRLANAMIEAGETPPDYLRWDLEEWNLRREYMKRSSQLIQEEIQTIQEGYAQAFEYRASSSYWMQTRYFFRYAALDVFGMMTLGMALFKSGVLGATRSKRCYLLFALLGYGIGLPTNWLESAHYTKSGFDLVTYYQTSVTYDVGRVFTTLGHLGMILWIYKTGALRRLRQALASVGRMALTNYLSHTIVTTLVFVGFKQFGEWERYQLYYLVFLIWAAQLSLSPLWLARFRYGPAEWALRRLTYGNRQPFLRESSPRSLESD